MAEERKKRAIEKATGFGSKLEKKWDPVMKRWLKVDEDGNFIIDFHDPMPKEEVRERVREMMLNSRYSETEQPVKKRGGGYIDRMEYGGGGEVHNNKRRYYAGGEVKRVGAVEYQDDGNRVIRGGVKQ